MVRKQKQKKVLPTTVWVRDRCTEPLQGTEPMTMMYDDVYDVDDDDAAAAARGERVSMQER